LHPGIMSRPQLDHSSLREFTKEARQTVDLCGSATRCAYDSAARVDDGLECDGDLALSRWHVAQDVQVVDGEDVSRRRRASPGALVPYPVDQALNELSRSEMNDTCGVEARVDDTQDRLEQVSLAGARPTP
jgi:hypothetical protein